MFSTAASKMLRCSSFALAVHVLSSSRSATAARYNHLPAFSRSLSGFANNAISLPPRTFVRSNHHRPIPLKSKHATTISLLNCNQNLHLSNLAASVNIGSTCLFASTENNESSQPPDETSTPKEEDPSLIKDVQSIVTLVGAQGLLIPLSMALAKFLELPNRGLGSSFLLSNDAFVLGVQWTIPLFALAGTYVTSRDITSIKKHLFHLIVYFYCRNHEVD